MEKQKSLVECPICRNTLKKPVRMLKCGHNFCEDCLTQYTLRQRKKSCPCCRKQADLDFATIKNLPRNYTVENMIDDLMNTQLDSASDDETTKPYVTYYAPDDLDDLQSQVEDKISEKKYEEALQILRMMLHQAKGKDKIVPLLKKLQCLIETNDFKAVVATCKDFVSHVESMNLGKVSVNQTALDDYESRIQGFMKKVIQNPDAGAALIQCRFSLVRHHKTPKTRMFKLGSLGQNMLPIANKMARSDLKEEFKDQYKVMDEILRDMQKIDSVDMKERCKQVTWYLTQYGLCCTAIRDLSKSINIHHRAIGIMEFIFAGEAAKDKVYGHCHSNHGSAYELSGKLDNAKDSYQKAVESYKAATGTEKWKNVEQRKIIDQVEEYIARVESKLRQKSDDD